MKNRRAFTFLEILVATIIITVSFLGSYLFFISAKTLVRAQKAKTEIMNGAANLLETVKFVSYGEMDDFIIKESCNANGYASSYCDLIRPTPVPKAVTNPYNRFCKHIEWDPTRNPARAMCIAFLSGNMGDIGNTNGRLTIEKKRTGGVNPLPYYDIIIEYCNEDPVAQGSWWHMGDFCKNTNGSIKAKKAILHNIIPYPSLHTDTFKIKPTSPIRVPKRTDFNCANQSCVILSNTVNYEVPKDLWIFYSISLDYLTGAADPDLNNLKGIDSLFTVLYIDGKPILPSPHEMITQTPLLTYPVVNNNVSKVNLLPGNHNLQIRWYKNTDGGTTIGLREAQITVLAYPHEN